MGQQLQLVGVEDGFDETLHIDDKVVKRTQGVTASIAPSRARAWLGVADAGAVVVGFVVAFAIQRLAKPVSGPLMIDHVWLALSALPAFGVAAVVNHLYLARANDRPRDERRNILRTTMVGVGAVVLLAFAAQFKELSRLWVLLAAASVYFVWVAERRLARHCFTRLRAKGRLSRRILIVGTDAHAIGLLHSYQRNPAFGYHVVGFVGNDDLGSRGGAQVLGRIEDLDRVLVEHDVGGVVVSLGSVGQDHVNRMTRQLTDGGYHIALSSSLHDIDITRIRPQALDGNTMLYVEPVIRNGWRAVAKRLFDLFMASFILLISLPILFVAAVAIKFEDGGPVIFRQERVGRDGRLFTLMKLRTMVVDAESRLAELRDQSEVDGPLFKMTHDPRITRVGRWLRKLSIDELPQLIAVLKGTMSMVGPRPALPDEVEQWDEQTTERLQVMPGLTGLWQVSGRSDTSFEEYRRLDLYYVDNWTLAHDLRICAKTVGVVLTGRGAA